jgi:hypothetical protein
MPIFYRDNEDFSDATLANEAVNPGLNTWAGDPMVDPRVPFPAIVVILGMLIVAAIGLIKNREK